MTSNIYQIKQIPIQSLLLDEGITITKNNQFLATWRAELTPSCSIKDNLFKDFGGGQGGSIIDLYSLIHSVDIKTAVKELEDRYIKNTQTPLKQEFKAINPPANKEKIACYKYNDIYQYFLGLSPLEGEGLTYLANRKLDVNLLKAFKFGFVDGSKETFHRVKNSLLKRFELKDLQEAGLFNEAGQYKGFNNSIIIPFFSWDNMVSNLQFRKLEPDSKYKYIYLKNRTKTPWLKDVTLEILKAKYQSVTTIITEGVFDCLAGIYHLPAETQSFVTGIALGSASDTGCLTDTEISLIMDRSDRVIFCLDSDTAGQEAMDSLNNRFKRQGDKNKIEVWQAPDKIKDLNQYFINQ